MLDGIYGPESLGNTYANEVVRAAGEMSLIRDRCSSFLKGGRALDVGCGLGGFLDVLCQEGMKATGLDAYERRADAARAHGLDVKVGRFNRQTLETLFNDESFDLISLRGALSYMDDQGEVFALARERLNRDGMLYISEHMASSPYYWFGVPLITRVGRIATVFFDRHSLLKSFNIYGFEAVAVLPEWLPPEPLIKAWRVPSAFVPLFKRLLPYANRVLPADYLSVLARTKE
jgi:SAM-dependent methyltransferase